MKKSFFTLCLIGSLTIFTSIQAEPAQTALPSEEASPQESTVMFTPPSGWHLGELNKQFPSVKAMVVGKSTSVLPPSMNLCTSPYEGTLRQYLKIVKNMNMAKGNEWKDLGFIRTEAGQASLSQVDEKSQWGELRSMHVILVKNGTVYILTAAALKNEFSLFYKDFFAAMRSLKIVN